MQVCPKCGAPIPQDATVCPMCGTSITQNASTTAVYPPISSQPTATTNISQPVNTSNPSPLNTSSSTLVTPPTKKKMKWWTKLLIVLVVVLVVLGIISIAVMHSRPFAKWRYEQSVQQLTPKTEQLNNAVNNSTDTMKKISALDLDQPSTFHDYKQSLAAANSEQNTIDTANKKYSDTNYLDNLETDEILRIASQNFDMANAADHDATDLTQKTKAVTDSKARADKTLGPVEQALTAAEKQKEVNDAETGTLSLDLRAIAAGDYSSMDGTWTNSSGSWIRIQDGQVIPQNSIPGTTSPYSLRECIMSTDNCAMPTISVPKTQYQLVQDGAVQNNHGNSPDIHYLLFVVQKNSSLVNTSFLGSNTSFDPTDSTRDRIIPSYNINNGDGGPICKDSSYAYYRTEGTSSNVSTKDQELLADDISNAQKQILTLNLDWQKDAKNAFQCRLDVVSGQQNLCDLTINPDYQ